MKLSETVKIAKIYKKNKSVSQQKHVFRELPQGDRLLTMTSVMIERGGKTGILIRVGSL